MKKFTLIFLRVIFVIGTILGVSFYSLKFYFQMQSDRAIEKALVIDDFPVIGNREAPFTLVEFFDYRCVHCLEISKIVDEAVNSDKNIKILLRPVIVSDEESFKIAALVLAADMQKEGATIAIHKEIMALSAVPTYETVKAIAEANQIKIQQAEKDAEIFKPLVAQNTNLIADIGFYGVPALIIGDKGFISQGQMPGVNELRLMILDAKQRLNIK